MVPGPVLEEIIQEQTPTTCSETRRGKGRLFYFKALLFLALVAALVSFESAGKKHPMGDFTKYSLAASRILREGGNPYLREAVGKNYKYLPTNALLLTPLTMIPENVAAGMWFAINLALLLWCFSLHRDWIAESMGRIPWWVWGCAVAITLRLLWANFRLGQWNLSVYCLAFAGVALLRSDKTIRGALLLGLSATLKYMPAFFAVYLAARGQWKKAGAVVLAIAFWAMLFPGFLLGPERHAQLLSDFQKKAEKQTGSMRFGDRSSSLSVRSTLYRYLSPVSIELDHRDYRTNILNLEPPTAARISDSVAGGILIAAIAVTALLKRQERQGEHISSQEELLLVGGWFATFLMISPGARHAQLLTLFTPCFAIAAIAAGLPDSQATQRRRLLIILGLAFFLMTSPARFIRGSHYQHWFETIGTPAAAMLLLWATCVCLSLRFSARPRIPSPE